MMKGATANATGRASPDAVVDFCLSSASKTTFLSSTPARHTTTWATATKRLFLATLCIALYLYVVINRPQQILERYLQESVDQSLWYQLKQARAPSLILSHRYLVFVPFGPGQGTGNIMHGLLAAHLLGLEFDRIVCVSSNYTEFHWAFEWTPSISNNHALQACPTLPQYDETPDHSNTIELVSYRPPPPNERVLQQRLLSNTTVLYYFGNTYPRWPATIPRGLFFQYYRPTRALQALLPSSLPSIVVHLRQGDSSTDSRKGLDEATFHALGRYLQEYNSVSSSRMDDTHPYLVTNRVAWYEWFATHYAWQHPDWLVVRHSAFHSTLWGTRGSDASRRPVSLTKHTNKTNVNDYGQALQMWSDWYVLLNAHCVVHTHSDFSLSAVHWNNVNSATIEGVNVSTGRLELAEEFWRRDTDEPPQDYLVDRSMEQLQVSEHEPDSRLPTRIRDLYLRQQARRKAEDAETL